MSSGYVYLLINQSMEGIVKIGKTTRDPQNRVNELSNATGIPTPFTLIYKQFFNNCSDAEKAIHTNLGHYRVANNREFFKIAVYEAIDIIQNTSDRVKKIEEQVYETKELPSKVSNLAYQLFKQGLEYYNGENDRLQDYKEALNFFKQASKLRSVEAYKFLGIMHLEGHGVKINAAKALEYYKEGALKGNNLCYALMASLYLLNEELKHTENGMKCFEMYFKHINHDFILTEDITHFMHYLIFVHQNNDNISYQSVLGRYKSRIVNRIEAEKDNYRYWFQEDKQLLDICLKDLDEIKGKVEFEIVGRERLEDFYAEIETYFQITGRGIFLVASIIHGAISVGDNIEIIGRNFTMVKPVRGLEKNRQLVDSTSAGENVGINIGMGDEEEYLFTYESATAKKAYLY